MRHVTRYFLLIVAVTVIAACKSAFYVPTEANTKPDANLSQLKEGHDIYMSRCGNCHKLYAPTKFNGEEWPGILDKMQPKAKITDAQKEAVFAYLVNAPR